ncbi:MAG: AMP-binding protein [Candidatus Lokiarchaeota archaeon]|nr:AMP-binding protein [Candidatus Lokiarchaeota archaeon]MBD3200811.1 AMP-binding protein [Candidatus Lokiarchaeota archaeon]
MSEKMIQSSPYSQRIWLDAYDDHVKPDLDVEMFSLDEMLKRSVRRYPESLAYDFQGTCATYKEMLGYVNSFANFLNENGVKKGDRVVINLPNLPQFIISLFGTFFAGCGASGMNFLLSPSEINYQLKDSGAVAIITLDSFYEEKVRDALKNGDTDVKLVITTNVADVLDLDPKMKEQLIKIGKLPQGNVDPIEGLDFFTYNDVLLNYPDDYSPDVLIEPDDLLLLQYTGGTTGPPKGAILTHRNLISLIQIVNHWFEPSLNPGNNVYVSGFPFFHLAGLQFCLQTVAQACAQILVPDPRDTNYMTSKLKEYEGKIGLMYNVPTLYMMLLKNRRFKKLDLTSVDGYISGAAPFPSKNIKEFEEVVGKSKLVEAYGMTEASPGVSMNPFLGEKKIGTVGVPFPNTHVKIVDVSDREKEVSLGEPGEIAIKGPQIFSGYWNKQEESKHALVDGWFYSGDVGIMDEDGYITIVDRTKDMINVSGYKVFSVEVDDKMNKHPAIELCACVGVPDQERPGSEYVKLYCQLKKGYEASEDTKKEILKFAQKNLAKYKIPREIEMLEQLPLTSVGKVDKKVLRKK